MEWMIVIPTAPLQSLWQSVGPDEGIKSSPIISKVAQKIAAILLL